MPPSGILSRTAHLFGVGWFRRATGTAPRLADAGCVAPALCLSASECVLLAEQSVAPELTVQRRLADVQLKRRERLIAGVQF